LVVVHDGDVEGRFEALLDLEAARRGNVLEVDAAERRGDGLHDADDLVGVLRAQAERPAIDVGEFLEQGDLAFHDGHGGGGAEGAQAEDGGAVADDGDGVGPGGEGKHLVGVGGDGPADAGDAWGVDHGQGVAGLDGVFAAGGDLAAEVGQEDAIGGGADGDVGQGAEPGDDLFGVGLGAGVEGDVPDHSAAADLDDVDGSEVGALLGEEGGQPG